MNELDFSGKQILVVGGSSGIGNGIAQAFRAKGARVHVCGTRAAASDYSPGEGSHLEGLQYSQLDVGNAQAIATFNPPLQRLDVLVLGDFIATPKHTSKAAVEVELGSDSCVAAAELKEPEYEK